MVDGVAVSHGTLIAYAPHDADRHAAGGPGRPLVDLKHIRLLVDLGARVARGVGVVTVAAASGQGLDLPYVSHVFELQPRFTWDNADGYTVGEVSLSRKLRS